ncbi:MAG: 30S ribosome-binding factor RbfA [Bacilli bacterium]|jgi:ribosome-binding factor A
MDIIRAKRIASSLQREISDIIASELRDADLQKVTVTHLKLARDLGYARIFVTTVFDENKGKVVEDLNNAKGFIKSELCRRKFEIRTIPDLEFVYDESLAYADNIEEIIKKLHSDKKTN